MPQYRRRCMQRVSMEPILTLQITHNDPAEYDHHKLINRFIFSQFELFRRLPHVTILSDCF